MRALSMLLLLWAMTATAQTTTDAPTRPLDFEAMRNAMVDEIDRYARLARDETGVEAIDPAVLVAMREVPRHAFVPEKLRPFAYFDVPLPVGHEQNIAQPFLIALMTHLARVGPRDVVFETGTGAGYHAALLSKLAGQVYSVEVVAPLAEAAAGKLRELGYANVEVRTADGYYGWRERGPYDAMIIKEAIHHVPPPLLNQLKPGGRLVAPVGTLDGTQWLTLIVKRQDGTTTEKRLIPVRFSPLQGGERI